jgi:formate hydrogenlyase subunit 6/NADH:ubiquinone oxidoreductase subunit I
VVPRIGYCEPSCVLCGQVCPSGAIWEISAKEKAWVADAPDARPVRLGLAFYDRGRCLPWAMATECIVCEEWCPVTPKAIYLRQAEVFDRDGKPKQVRQPYVDPERCVGCGACEFACPEQDRPAIYVTSIGESRAKNNQLLLKRTSAVASRDLFPATGDVPGWSKSGATRTFAAADLWQYIDGDAEKYIQAGVQRSATADYRYSDGLETTVDIHTMSAAAGAKRLFESEPAGNSKAIPLGDAARSYGAVFTFRKGVYFVRLVVYQETPQTSDALAVLARAIEGRLP